MQTGNLDYGGAYGAFLKPFVLSLSKHERYVACKPVTSLQGLPHARFSVPWLCNCALQPALEPIHGHGAVPLVLALKDIERQPFRPLEQRVDFRELAVGIVHPGQRED